jgi:hypothetical protein
MMAIIHLANQPDAIHRFLVAQMAGKRVAGVGRQRDNGAVADEFNGLSEQALLRRFWINFDEAGDVFINESNARPA